MTRLTNLGTSGFPLTSQRHPKSPDGAYQVRTWHDVFPSFVTSLHLRIRYIQPQSLVLYENPWIRANTQVERQGCLCFVSSFNFNHFRKSKHRLRIESHPCAILVQLAKESPEINTPANPTGEPHRGIMARRPRSTAPRGALRINFIVPNFQHRQHTSAFRHAPRRLRGSTSGSNGRTM